MARDGSQDFSAPSATTPASDAGAAASQDPRFPTIAAHGADSGPGLPSASDSQPRAAPSDDLQSSGPPKLPHLSSLMPPLSFSGQASPITPAPLPPFPVPPSMAPVGHSGPDPWAMGVPGIASPSPSTRTREATSRTAALLGRRRPTAEITEEELSRYFHLPSEEACKRLGVGLTVLKRQCRKYGILRWPYRKIKSLDKLIENVRNGHVPGDRSADVISRKVDELEMQKARMLLCQTHDLDEETKRLQQAYSKASHKLRKARGTAEVRAKDRPAIQVQVPLTGPDGQRAYVSVSVVKPLGQGRGAPRPRDLDSSRILAAMQAALPEALARAAEKHEREAAEAAATLGTLTAMGAPVPVPPSAAGASTSRASQGADRDPVREGRTRAATALLSRTRRQLEDARMGVSSSQGPQESRSASTPADAAAAPSKSEFEAVVAVLQGAFGGGNFPLMLWDDVGMGATDMTGDSRDPHASLPAAMSPWGMHLNSPDARYPGPLPALSSATSQAHPYSFPPNAPLMPPPIWPPNDVSAAFASLPPIQMGVSPSGLPVPLPMPLPSLHMGPAPQPHATVPAGAVPATAGPANAIPANAVPATAVPANAANAVLGNAVPANAVPATAVPASAVPANAPPVGVMGVMGVSVPMGVSAPWPSTSGTGSAGPPPAALPDAGAAGRAGEGEVAVDKPQATPTPSPPLGAAMGADKPGGAGWTVHVQGNAV